MFVEHKRARYRLGPELEVCGYGCEDHFLEQDTVTHSWECIAELLKTDLTDNILACHFLFLTSDSHFSDVVDS